MVEGTTPPVVHVTALVVVIGGKSVVGDGSGELPTQPEINRAAAKTAAASRFTALLLFAFVLVPEKKPY